MGSIGAIGVGLVPKKVENKLTNKGKYTHVSLMRQLSLIVDEAARQVGEGFDAAIAQEGPPTTHAFTAMQIQRDDDDFFVLRRGLREQFALRSGYET